MAADKGRKGATQAEPKSKAQSDSRYTLVIVESPSKTKKLEKILGSGYRVKASFGHIRDLPKDKDGVAAPNFKPQYVITKEDAVKILRKELAGADRVLLATDPDREGEAIAWHLREVLKPDVPVFRMTFNAITDSAVKAGLQQLRQLDMALVNAQEARRVVDRLVGFQTTDVLWKVFTGKGLSAGRVQTVALRIVVERQDAIDAFRSRDYFELKAKLRAKSGEFSARLIEWAGKAVDSSSFPDKASIMKVMALVQVQNWKVDDLREAPKARSPKAPFITSTLQQVASSFLNFSPDVTMDLAQKLYESGCITYMRTDSPAVAPEAVSESASWLEETFGKEYLPKVPRSFQAKGDAQEAHECIRPTDISLRELDVIDDEDVSKEMAQLYSLIWQRFAASQMADAVDDETRVRMRVSDGVFETLGRVERFDGWRRVYNFDEDEAQSDDEDAEVIGKLPKIQLSEPLKLESLEPLKKQTKAPKAFTEASLVRALEAQGVGRPSTFANIIATLKKRDYVEMSKKKLVPTALGVKICNFLKKQFPELFDVGFTASMEKDLDAIALSKNSYLVFMRGFWGDFSAWMEAAGVVAGEAKAEREAMMPKCPKCGAPLRECQGKKGKFLGCSNYPKCSHAQSIGLPAN